MPGPGGRATEPRRHGPSPESTARASPIERGQLASEDQLGGLDGQVAHPLGGEARIAHRRLDGEPVEQGAQDRRHVVGVALGELAEVPARLE